MCYTAVIKIKGDLRQGQLIIDQQFLYFLDTLIYKIFFNCSSFNGRKQTAQVSIFMINLAGYIAGKFFLIFILTQFIPCLLNYQLFNSLNECSIAVVDQFKTNTLKTFY